MAKSKKLKCRRCKKSWTPLVAGHKPMRCPRRTCQARDWEGKKRA